MKQKATVLKKFTTLFSLAMTSVLFCTAVPKAWCWESETTHAGLAETSAMDSLLHQKLSDFFGEKDGLFTDLRIPESDAVNLYKILAMHSPIEGFTPDSSGTQTAMAWFVAGAVIADSPASFAAKHFYDALASTSTSNFTKASEGANALKWITSHENPMGYKQFLDQYKKAIKATTKKNVNGISQDCFWPQVPCITLLRIWRHLDMSDGM